MIQELLPFVTGPLPGPVTAGARRAPGDGQARAGTRHQPRRFLRVPRPWVHRVRAGALVAGLGVIRAWRLPGVSARWRAARRRARAPGRGRLP